MSYSHRSNKLDEYIGKRVKVVFTDGDIIVGILGYDKKSDQYALKNCIDIRKGWVRNDVMFRKSHIKSLKED